MPVEIFTHEPPYRVGVRYTATLAMSPPGGVGRWRAPELHRPRLGTP